MTTLVDSLVLELGLDPTKFSAGLRNALSQLSQGKNKAKQDASDIESFTKSAGEGLNRLTSTALKLAAVFTAGMGLKEFVQHTVITDRTVGRLSNVIGISSEKISAWQGAAKLWGGSAEGITTLIRNLSVELGKFSVTGESSIIPYLRGLGINVVDGAGKFKKSTDLLLEVADAVQNRRLDPAQATYILQSLGADDATINAMLKGRRAMEQYLKTSRDAGVITKEDVDAADQLTASWNRLERQSSSLGRMILTRLTPALTSVMNATSEAIDAVRDPGAHAKERVELGNRMMHGLIRVVVGPKAAAQYDEFMKKNPQLLDNLVAPFNTLGGKHGGGGGAINSREAMEAYIVAAARARHIDPNVALAVARSEGIYGVGPSLQSNIVRNGKREESYGPFQLYMGGGLGNEFQKKTGLDPRNPATIKQQIDFALDYASKEGWGSWHGWHGAAFAGIDRSRSGAAGLTQHVTVQRIDINVPHGDASAIGSALGRAIARQGIALQGNRGAE